MSNDNKVIDWRCRPPLKPYKGLFDLRINLMAGRPNTLAGPTSWGKAALTSKAISMVGEPGGMEQWWKEIDAAGVDIVVANGRYAAGDPNMLCSRADNSRKITGQLAESEIDQPMRSAK